MKKILTGKTKKMFVKIFGRVFLEKQIKKKFSDRFLRKKNQRKFFNKCNKKQKKISEIFHEKKNSVRFSS